MVTGIVIPHETRLEIFTNEFSDLASYQAAVGGYIEPIHLDGHPLVIVANEEGKLVRLPVNRRATCLWWLLNPTRLGGDALVGDVAIVGPIEQGEMSDAPSKLVSLVATVEDLLAGIGEHVNCSKPSMVGDTGLEPMTSSV